MVLIYMLVFIAAIVWWLCGIDFFIAGARWFRANLDLNKEKDEK